MWKVHRNCLPSSFFQGGKPKELVRQGFILSAKPGHPSASAIRGVISLVRRHMDLMLRAEGIALHSLPGEAVP